VVYQVQTLDVPAPIWPLYFDALARRFQGWCIDAEAMRDDLGDQPLVEDERFYGISFEKRGTASPAVILQAGDETVGIANHFIHDPIAVREATTRPGDEADIQIESSDGTVTLLRLKRRLALPPGRDRTILGRIAQRWRGHARETDVKAVVAGAALGVTAIALGIYLLRRATTRGYKNDGRRISGRSAQRSKASRIPVASFTACRP
jgi:hypothetical protein